MQHAYLTLRLLLAALFFLGAGDASAQMAWRPFRSGLIYSYGTAGRDEVYTLRLDSAYVTAGGDSAWAFNRVLREIGGKTPGEANARFFRRSRNNLFGQRLTWQPGSAEYALETVAEGPAQAGATLRLRPRAPLGSTWAASSQPALTATLTGRGLQAVGNQTDTVATITLSSGAVLRLSRRFGLLDGPQWLAPSSSAGQWAVAQLPTSLAQSPYSPARLFDLQPGDELGYLDTPIFLGPFICSDGRVLRRILSRSMTNDSLIYTFREQWRIQSYSGFGCGPSVGTNTMPPTTGRWAFSLRTGQSSQFIVLPLLSGEYRLTAGTAYLGRGLALPAAGIPGCGGTALVLAFDQVFGNFALNQFGPVPDYDGRQQFSSALGVGATKVRTTALNYYRRTVNGTAVTCGPATAYTGLLPARAAQAAAVASLFPNPAADAAVLTLAAPARPGTRLVLRDALGRLLWQTPVPAGHTEAAVPLVGRPAGLYLLQVEQPKAASVTLRLNKE